MKTSEKCNRCGGFLDAFPCLACGGRGCDECVAGIVTECNNLPPETAEQAEATLRAAGVDVDGFLARARDRRAQYNGRPRYVPSMEDPEKLRAQARDIVSRQAQKCVSRIIADLSDRAGLSDAWWEIDEGTRAEILAQWHAIVADTMGFPK